MSRRKQAGSSSSSLVMSLLAVLARELFGILHELLAVLEKLLGQLGTQWMLRFWIIDEGDERLNH